MNMHARISFASICATSLITVIVIGLVVPTPRRSVALVAEASATRIIRPTLTPAFTPLTQQTSQDPNGYIALQITNLRPSLYTVVQWKGREDQFFTVEGWQAEPDSSGAVRWTVYPRDLGSGPFRFVVFASKEGRILATSDLFALPCCGGSTKIITMSIPSSTDRGATQANYQ